MRVEEDTVPSINNPEYDKAVLRNKPEILTINEPDFDAGPKKVSTFMAQLFQWAK